MILQQLCNAVYPANSHQICTLPKGHTDYHQSRFYTWGDNPVDSTDTKEPSENPPPGYVVQGGKDEIMQRHFGIQPGGGLINIYHFDSDSFGVVGERAVQRIIATTRRERRAAYSEVGKMLRAFKLIDRDEKVLSLSLGTDPKGNAILVVTGIIGGATV